MGCCRVEARRTLPQMATPPVSAVLTQWVVVTQVLPVDHPSQFAASATFHNPPNEYPPPGLVAAETTVLRI